LTIILPNSGDASNRRITLLQVLFTNVEPDVESYACIAKRAAGRGAFSERLFRWPDETDELRGYVDEAVSEYDVYLCPMLFGAPLRKKEHVSICPTVWADLDTCPPSELLVPASVEVESSPARWQTYWILPEPVPPAAAEDMARRIAYYHAPEGADRSGWDLTQLLRMPFTFNFKYDPPPVVAIRAGRVETAFAQLAAEYPNIEMYEGAAWDFPESIPNGYQVLGRHEHRLDSHVFRLIEEEPEHDWSRQLWALEMRLCELGLEREEILGVVRIAGCNKYQRDNRDEKVLWAEICKAWALTRETTGIVSDVAALKVPDVLSDEDLAAARSDRTFVEEYMDWAQKTTDAAPDYHEAGAFTALSSMLASTLRLPAAFGGMGLNMWFMLLGETTLTRKTTAMNLSTDMIFEIDEDVLLATDGSLEGIFTAMSECNGKASLFLVDEFSGMLNSMVRKEYYAGMPEMLTKLYDGKPLKRRLRREMINVREPIFSFFAGGIKGRIQRLLTIEHIASGFLARFVLIQAEVDMDRLRPMQRLTDDIIDGRNYLVTRLRAMKERYRTTFTIHSNGTRNILENRPEIVFTDDAWNLYNELESRLIKSVATTPDRDLLIPMMDRLSKSGLKASALVAASRMEDDAVHLQERDILKGFQYVSGWRDHTIEVLSHIGISQTEHKIQLVLNEVIRNQDGIQRSKLMQNHHLTAKDTDMIFDTLLQRGLVRRERIKGRGETLFPMGA
jgi:hypothetical protein